MAKHQAVVERELEDGSTVYDFICPYPIGCGEPGGGPFRSTAWRDREHARQRGLQHIAEHKGESVAEPLDKFMRDRGLVRGTLAEDEWEI